MLTTFFSNVVIVPISNLLEIFFFFFKKVTNPGIAVVGLSFVVTICCLPLYIVAEHWQEEERNIQKKLEAGVKRIKSAFHKDEQYMILSTYYRQNHYHPMMALRSSFSLLIQIPFFIAAYTFLSHLEELQGRSFLFIQDLGKSDALFSIGSFKVNILPIAMTLINCISGAIYSKGHGIKEKIQLYATAAVFLVLLYNSPAGLVVYWTMNNILSLVKNIFYKLKNPLKVFHIVASVAMVCIAIWATIHRHDIKVYFVGALVFGALVVVFIPIILKGINYFAEHALSPLSEHKQLRLGLFILSALVLAVAAGLTIPSNIIDSSSSDYFYIDSYKSPMIFIIIAFLQALGLFLFWPFCLYALFPTKFKNIITFLWGILAFTGVLNCFAFSGDYGLMDVQFALMDESQSFMLPPLSMILNFVLSVGIIAALLVLIKKRLIAINYTAGIILTALSVFAVKNMASIQQNFNNTPEPERVSEPVPEFHLSKTGKNVIVIMEDRAVSALVDDIFEARPELKQKWSGFTYYPNTVAMSHYTTLGAPGLFGGYDFTPWEINKRDLTIREKHNQSLLVMPSLFLNAGYDVTVTNLPYENYNLQPMTQIYKPYPQIHRVVTQGAYSQYWYSERKMEEPPYTSYHLKKNILYFSLFKLATPASRTIIYGLGFRLTDDPYYSAAYLVNAYTPLAYLPKIFDTTATNNSFVLFDNELTHVGGFLQAPDYYPVQKVTNYGEGRWAHSENYHVNMAAMLRWGEFFDYLRENDCYDNTRIIFVSDHGDVIHTGKFDNTTKGFSYPKESLQAILFVKDFGAQGEVQTDMTFMTNADTPTLALQGIIDHPKNPFTGNDMTLQSENKQDYVKISTASMQSLRTRDDIAFTVPNDKWITVHDDIFNDDNWSYVYGKKTDEKNELTKSKEN